MTSKTDASEIAMVVSGCSGLEGRQQQRQGQTSRGVHAGECRRQLQAMPYSPFTRTFSQTHCVPACRFAGYRLRRPEPLLSTWLCLPASKLYIRIITESNRGVYAAFCGKIGSTEMVPATKLMQAQMPSSDVSVFVVPPKAASFTWEDHIPTIQRRDPSQLRLQPTSNRAPMWRWKQRPK